MSDQEQVNGCEQGYSFRDPREVWIAERDALVMVATRLLIEPLIDDNPFARFSLGSVLKQISEETGVARALVHGALKNASERKVPFDDKETVLNIACEKGNFYVHATRPFEEIQPLLPREDNSDNKQGE